MAHQVGDILTINPLMVRRDQYGTHTFRSLRTATAMVTEVTRYRGQITHYTVTYPDLPYDPDRALVYLSWEL